jgi:uncharacterized membrane protein HdeD (DUF308 family)
VPVVLLASKSADAASAMNARTALAVLWLLFGIGLVAEGIYEVAQWSADPALRESSLRWWHSTGIVPGALSVLLAYQLFRAQALAKYLGYFMATVLTLYVLYILALTPVEFIVRPMLLLQIFVIVLCIATSVFLYRANRRSS